MPLDWDDQDEKTEVEAPKPAPKPVVKHEAKSTSFEERVDPFDKTGLEDKFLPATMAGRFAAFAVDTTLILFLYRIISGLLALSFRLPDTATLSQYPRLYGLSIALTVILGLVYYSVLEKYFGKTLGKWFCELRVVGESGEAPSFGAILMRNSLRLIDYPAFFLVAVILMESSPLRQRLGDRAAKTFVIQTRKKLTVICQLSQTPLASTLSRLLAGIVDLIFAGLLGYGVWLGKTNHSSPFAALFFFVGYFVVLEKITGTTLGKALLQRAVILDHGYRLNWTGAILRNLFRPFDLAIGYLLIVLSDKKQRLGDIVANTLVIARAPKKSTLIFLGVVGASILLFSWGSYRSAKINSGAVPLNPATEFKQSLKTWLEFSQPTTSRFAPIVDNTPQTPSKTSSGSSSLEMKEFNLATGPEPGQIRQDATFALTDPIYLFFKVENFKTDANGGYNLVEDLRVENTQGQMIFEQKQIANPTGKISYPNQNLLFANHLKLSNSLKPGTYRIKISIEDKNEGATKIFEKDFKLTP